MKRRQALRLLFPLTLVILAGCTHGMVPVGGVVDWYPPNESFPTSTIGKDGKHGWDTYPRLSMSGSSMQGRSQHEKYFVSTIDIRGQ